MTTDADALRKRVAEALENADVGLPERGCTSWTAQVLAKAYRAECQRVAELEAEVERLGGALILYGAASGMGVRPQKFLERLGRCPEETPGRDSALAEIVSRRAREHDNARGILAAHDAEVEARVWRESAAHFHEEYLKEQDNERERAYEYAENWCVDRAREAEEKAR